MKTKALLNLCSGWSKLQAMCSVIYWSWHVSEHVCLFENGSTSWTLYNYECSSSDKTVTISFFLSFHLCVLSVIPLSHATTLNIYADMNTLSLCLTSGSRFLKTYILVFSIMENRSGLSLAHFISQTSLRSNLDGSPGVDPPSASPDEARVSTSKNVNTPVISIIASRLKKDICFKTNSHSTSRKRDWLI